MGFGDRPEPYEESGLARDIRRMREQDRAKEAAMPLPSARDTERRRATGSITDWPGSLKSGAEKLRERGNQPNGIPWLTLGELAALTEAADIIDKQAKELLGLQLRMSAIMASIPDYHSDLTTAQKCARFNEVRRMLYPERVAPNLCDGTERRLKHPDEVYTLRGDVLNPACCSAAVPCDHQRKSPGTICATCTLAHLARAGRLKVLDVYAQLVIDGASIGDAQPCKLYVDTESLVADVDRHMVFDVGYVMRDTAKVEVRFYDGTTCLCGLNYRTRTEPGDTVKVTPGRMGGVPAPISSESPHRFSVTR